jgi:hypothetical protein
VAHLDLAGVMWNGLSTPRAKVPITDF